MCVGFPPYLSGLKLQGAVCKKNTLSLSSTILTELPLSSLQWVRVDPANMHKMAEGKVID